MKLTVYRLATSALARACAKFIYLKANVEGAERFLTAAFSQPSILIHNVAISCHDFRFAKEGNEFFRTKQLIIDALTASGYKTRTQQTGTDYIDDWVYGQKGDTSNRPETL